MIIYKGNIILLSELNDVKMFKKYEETVQSARYNTPIILTMEWIKREVPNDFINLLKNEKPERILLAWKNYETQYIKKIKI